MVETPTLPATDMGNAVAQKRVEAPLVSITWQILLGVVAALSALLMLLMRGIASSRWR